jgi:F-type H+-transporting ATPase subunit delta
MPAVEPAVVARALYDSLQATLQDQGADDQFDQVVQAFVDLVRGTGPRDAEVTSALPLESAHQDAIVQQLRGKYGPALDIKFTVDPAILGGLIVRVGDRVLDESVRRRLAEVQQRMLAS